MMGKKKDNRGGYRPSNPGGRPHVEGARRVPRAIRVSEEMDAYLREVGSGIIEDVVRRTKAFRDWASARKCEQR